MVLLAELYIYTVYIYIYIDSIRDSLNKKAVRTLKACELYLFDFDMYTCMYCVFELLYLPPPGNSYLLQFICMFIFML